LLTTSMPLKVDGHVQGSLPWILDTVRVINGKANRPVGRITSTIKPIGRDCPKMKSLGDEAKATMTKRWLLPTNSLMPMVPASQQGSLKAAKVAKAKVRAREKAKAENLAKADISSKQRAKANTGSRKAKGKAIDREVTPRIPKAGKVAQISSSNNAKRPECA